MALDHHLEKCMRIISDLVSYCHWAGAQEFAMSVKHSEKDALSTVTLDCLIPQLEDGIVEELHRTLNAHRQREVEQNYWELSGEAEMSGELTLVGMMIDSAEVWREGEMLHIVAHRKD